jgi:hypothetical protein
MKPVTYDWGFDNVLLWQSCCTSHGEVTDKRKAVMDWWLAGENWRTQNSTRTLLSASLFTMILTWSHLRLNLGSSQWAGNTIAMKFQNSESSNVRRELSSHRQLVVSDTCVFLIMPADSYTLQLCYPPYVAVHAHGRWWMSKQSFVLMHCFHSLNVDNI